jgi:hypothetical protein
MTPYIRRGRSTTYPVERKPNDHSMANAIGRHFGIDRLQCPNYAALHGVESIKICEHMDRIRKTTFDILNGVEGENERISPPKQLDIEY